MGDTREQEGGATQYCTDKRHLRLHWRLIHPSISLVEEESFEGKTLSSVSLSVQCLGLHSIRASLILSLLSSHGTHRAE